MTDDKNRKPFGVEYDDPLTVNDWAVILILLCFAIVGITGVLSLLFLLMGVM